MDQFSTLLIKSIDRHSNVLYSVPHSWCVTTTRPTGDTMRALAVALAFLIVLTTSPAGTRTLSFMTTLLVAQGSGDIPEFDVDPLDLDDAPTPDLDDHYRAGTWNDDSLEALAD